MVKWIYSFVCQLCIYSFDLIFYVEKAAEIDGVRQQLQAEMSSLQTTNQRLNEELKLEKELLEKARSGLDAARELNIQIDEKSRAVSTLKTQSKHFILNHH